jgi:hypothetical protein
MSAETKLDSQASFAHVAVARLATKLAVYAPRGLARLSTHKLLNQIILVFLLSLISCTLAFASALVDSPKEPEKKCEYSEEMNETDFWVSSSMRAGSDVSGEPLTVRAQILFAAKFHLLALLGGVVYLPSTSSPRHWALYFPIDPRPTWASNLSPPIS